jgi:dCTP deaminase
VVILHDGALRQVQDKWTLIEPFNHDHVQPASIDLTLGNEFIANGARFAVAERCSIAPREFILGTTVERVFMPAHFVGKVMGRSSWARKGLVIESAGLVDPGFSGQLTLELYNFSSDTLYLPVGGRICQMTVETMSGTAERPYGSKGLGSHYQDQTGTTPSAL